MTLTKGDKLTVPIGENNRPMAKVGNGAKETIPTVQYGNITIGPAYVEKYVDDDHESITTGLQECLDAAEEILGSERDRILEQIRTSGIR